jgi:hypothetical protein
LAWLPRIGDFGGDTFAGWLTQPRENLDFRLHCQ